MFTGKEQIMKGKPQVITHLNKMLADELTAINQYIVHSEMCANWGYSELHKYIEGRAIVEMKHAEMLIARLLFLDGAPTVSNLNKINIGKDVKLQFENDLSSELGAQLGYNEGIRIAVENNDNGTREMFGEILGQEEEHSDWLEAQLDQISQMGIENYLAEQVD
jgi:bacterioferritin